MQDIHTLGGGGGGGRIFTAAGLTGVARRLQPQNPHNHLPLKCPRCDSQNTKFCYYNNYNLSQPRHFCKNCRRYWTKGGVLRNVPVGGGCRKSKRSSKAKSSYTATTDGNEKNVETLTSHSSSETRSIVEDFNEFKPLVETRQVSSTTNMVGSSSGGELVGSNEGEKMMESTTNEIAGTGFIDHDHEVQVDPTAMEKESREGNSGLDTLDWGDVTGDPQPLLIDKTGGANGGEQDGLFDFGGVDEGYWNQAQWVDDQSFNFLPQFQVMDFNLGKK